MSFHGALAALARGLVLTLAFPALVLADVHVVDASGGGDFTTLQAAVNAASDGDTLLVRSGSYSGFLLTGKGLSIVAERGAEPQIAADVRIQGVPAGRTVVLSGLRVTATYTTDPTKVHALVVFDVGAAVRVQDCTLIGANNANDNQSIFMDGTGGSGAVLSSATNVVFTRCEVIGGRGHQHYDCCAEGGTGGEGLHSISSIVALYDCQLTGGLGGYSGWGGHGGPGAFVPDFGLFAAGCTFSGGKGGFGDDFIFGPGGSGGSGLRVGAAAQAQLRGNTFVGGGGGDSFLGQDGLPGVGLEAQAGSTVVQYPGSARRFTIEPVGWEGSLVPVTVEGEPGDKVWFPSSPKSGFRFAPALSGVWALALPVKMLLAPQGIVPASGVLELLVPITDLPGEGDLRHFQGYVISTSGAGFTGTPTSFVRLGCAFSGDCDGSGVPDACEIQSGAVSDCNHNGIPDSCDVASDVLPDCNANGTADLCDIQGGASVDCNLDGVPDECQYDCNGNGIADVCDVLSGFSTDCDANLVPDECDADCNVNAVPDACDIAQGTSFDANGNGVPDECQSPTDLYLVDDDGPPYGADGSPAKPFDTLGKAMAYAIDGNTISVLDGTYTGPENRGLGFEGRDLVIVSQNGAASVVIDCQAAERAFVFDAGTTLAARLEGLTIRNGKAASSPVQFDRGGGVLVQSGGAGTLIDCVIELCDGRTFGGGVYVAADADAILQGCDLRNNTAMLGGFQGCGGAGLSSFPHGAASTGTLVLDQCRITGNTGFQGSGLMLGSGYARVEDCIVSDNLKANFTFGGGIWHLGTGSLEVLRTRVSNNAGSGGAPGIYSESKGSVRVSHCIVAGNFGNSLGGGIGVRNFASPTLTAVIEHSLIAGNLAGDGAGVIATDVPSLSVLDCTIVQNSANTGGALRIVNVPSATVRNCVVWGNQASFQGPSLYVAGSPVDVAYCDVEGGLAGIFIGSGGSVVWGAGNLDLDPLFVDPDGADGNPATWQDNNHHLGAFSPCVDAGDNGAVGPDVFDLDGDLDFLEPAPLDLDLTPRFEDDPAVPDTGVGAPPIVDLGAFERP